MNIYESAEDYLEAILMLYQEKGYSRSVDIASRLGVTKPSVSFAMKRLRENGYITMDEESLITLTEKGEEIARRILERHRLLTAFFCSLGVDQATAREDACRVEHDISEETFQALRRHMQTTSAETAAGCASFQSGECSGDCRKG